MVKASDISPVEFGQLFIRYKEKYIMIARSFVRDRIVAEDIVADCFTAFWDNRGNIDLTYSPEGYILQSIRNRCLNYLRDEAVRMKAGQEMQETAYKNILAEMEILNGDDPSVLFREDIENIFRKMLGSMPELSRQIFYASRYHNMTYHEIASRFHVTERKVKREIQAVLGLMRTSLKDYINR